VTQSRILRLFERWFRLLQYFYPPGFRQEMGKAVLETYRDHASYMLKSGGKAQLVALWFRALIDSMRCGLAERLRPAAGRHANWGRDIEMVRRRLVRSPVFALTAVGTLTVGLGMFAVVYTAVQKILLDPMPYKNPDDLYYVWRDYRPINDISRGTLAGADILELQKPGRRIEGAVGLRPFQGGIFSPRESADTMEIAVVWTTPNLFDVLGVTPAIGRTFAPGESGPGRNQVIVLSNHLWKRLGADPGLVGGDIRLQGRPFRVIGVLPSDFTFVRNEADAPPQRVDAYIPLGFNLQDPNLRNNGYAAIVRARHGTAPEAVAAEIGAVGRTIYARDSQGRGVQLYPVRLKDDVISRIRPALVALGAAGILLLLMLMVNLASVLLSRAAQREHEVAVSRALGANAMAIAGSTLMEGGVLGFIGGALGALAAIWGTRALVALTPLDLPRRQAMSLDWRVAAIVISAGTLLGLLAAAAPAIWTVRTSLASLLAGSAVRGGGGHGRLRRAMVVVQVGFSLVLLTSGALVMRSFQRLLRADPGFRPEGVLTFRVRTPSEFFPKMSQAVEFQDRGQKALAAIPGVTGASAASVLPLAGIAAQTMITMPGAPGNTGVAERDQVLGDLVAVLPNYVEVMGMHLVEGRTFAELRPNGVAEVMIDTTLARRFFPGGNAVGAPMKIGNQPCTIIGVVGQARLYGVHVDGRPQVLIRAGDLGTRALYFTVRTAREPHSLFPEARAAVTRVDPRVPAGEERTMEDIVDAVLSPQSMGAALIGAFAAGALLLAAMGLFGVVSGSVTRRRHELAVRFALGADHGRVLRLVLKEGALLVVAGMAIGTPGIYFANRLLRGLLVGVSASDPLTLLAAAGGLLAVTMAACYVPARRVLKIELAELLRRE
jgi:putative ABC transport system permease protein